ncbi:response regulator [Agrobacterium vitis]|uniref:Response regulator n=1 Tax=Agrobacterium vitis TaxID=373 RepID=A0ABD6GAZ9_AGRVI|nr:HD domain-containing phosphohydrolase [Agrobacterium vitis]MUO79967.1 response regulator [Agrobacterium vitis]MUO93544.1 response regulator [Agrobacterium vitis]MUP04205.1 response regulator [Agrobacterium vitis]MUZ84311.1 response regulator [Agrobacterium vitis]MVA11128.1 response regulator [Agrobacterium vitis]
MRILLVDDNNTNLKLLTRLVKKIDHCEPVAFSTPEEVLSALPELDFDIAIIDYQMPVYNGVELYTEIVRFEKYAQVPVVFITADKDMTTRMAALNAGAIDFLTKPVNPIEFQARIHNIVSLSIARRQLADQAEWLRREVDRAVGELRQREQEIIERLTLAAGYKDPDTSRHTLRVAAYAQAIAREMGLPEQFCTDLKLAAPMHDIGKVAMPDTVLLKQGRLTESEYRQMQSHAQIGSDILAQSHSSLLQLAAEIAASHHERWDGQGYPNRLVGDAIPLSGRIVCIADNFDALTTERPYKPAWSYERTVEHVLARAGSQFDPACVAAFERALPAIREIIETDQREQAEEAARKAAAPPLDKIA